MDETEYAQAQQLAQDKTDFQVRLRLIARLRNDTSERSRSLLRQLLVEDFSFAVRVAAWEALRDMGEQVKRPQIREKYLLERFFGPVGRFFQWAWDSLPFWY